MRRYKVWMRSVPGPYEQYDGAVTVLAEDEESAVIEANRKLRHTSFPDRGPSMWRVEKIECVG